MRSRLAARSTRLVLAAAVMTALAATTACGSQKPTATGDSTALVASSSSARSGSEAPSGDGSSSDGPSTGGVTPAKGSSGGSSSEKSGSGSAGKGGSDQGGKSGYGQSCGTNDLNFTVTWVHEPEIDGYYLVAAKAKPGITCYLDVNTPSVSFGSGADGVASPVGQGGEDPIKLTGSATAYAGIDVKTTEGEGGTEFGNVIIAVTEDDPNPAELELPDMATVDKPVVTNWSPQRDEVVPRII
ncbi:DUF4232 domain-containing protein [Streptomyces sp. NBC_00178]|uniref:DUF4232 domain-containing protein n=1 Tax=Streptomyces sp. NBC_00178 TaxID=2975672 RepID=UPI002E27DC6F|nr:DUF4232 domain-containing protein [Streptomyces sp. NBC_00178]